jgi:hypothetical protein
MNNKIPVTGAKRTKVSEAAEAEAAEAEAVDVETAATMPDTEPGADAMQEEPEPVESQVVLAVKVTKKPRTPSKRDLAAQEEYTPRYETPARKPAAERPASFNPLAWVADGVTGAIEEVRHNDLGLSQAFWTHLYAVRRESLLTAQALVESLLAHVESQSEQQEDRKQRRERRGGVDIDF